MKSNRILMTVFSLMVIASMLLAGCGGGQSASGEKIKVGLSFSDFATERWKKKATKSSPPKPITTSNCKTTRLTTWSARASRV